MRRNRAVLAGVGAIFVVLLAASIVSAALAVTAHRAKLAAEDAKQKAVDHAARAEQERSKAAAATERALLEAEQRAVEAEGTVHLASLVLSTVFQHVYDGTMDTAAARRTLTDIDEEVRPWLTRHPDFEADLRGSMASAYELLGDDDEAARHREAALDILMARVGEHDSRTVDAMISLAGARLHQQRVTSAVELLDRAERILDEIDLPPEKRQRGSIESLRIDDEDPAQR